MATLALTRATIGLSNIYHDHHIRPAALDVSGNDLNNLLAARMGQTSRVEPVQMSQIAARSGGVSTQTQGTAYIEEGWAVSRGLGRLDFEIQGASPVQSQNLTVYGYMYNGSPVEAGGVLPADIMFVPVKMWLVESMIATDHTGFPVEAHKVRESGTFLMNDSSAPANSLHSIRPVDIINSASAYAAFDEFSENDNGIANAMDGYGGASSGLLSTIGMNISRSENNSQAHYANKLLTAAATASFEKQVTNDRYNAISLSAQNTRMHEIGIEENPFIAVMRSSLGFVSMNNFAGFNLGEIASVFENFNQVANVELTNSNNYNVEDYRYNTNQLAGSSFESIVCAELNNIANAVMNQHELSHFSVRSTNNIVDGSGQLIVNNLPVAYQLGQSAPMVDKDPDWMTKAVTAVEDLIAQFYAKYNATLIHERMLVNVDAQFSLFGDSMVTVSLHGDDHNVHTETFGTMAGNRFDPMLVTSQGLSRSTKGFYDNLTQYLNF